MDRVINSPTMVSFGLLSQITYPNGAWVKYDWETLDNVNDGAFTAFTSIGWEGGYIQPRQCYYFYGAVVVKARHVSYDGSTEALTQQFSYSPRAPGAIPETDVTTTDNIRGTSYNTSYILTSVPDKHQFVKACLNNLIYRKHCKILRHRRFVAKDRNKELERDAPGPPAGIRIGGSRAEWANIANRIFI